MRYCNITSVVVLEQTKVGVVRYRYACYGCIELSKVVKALYNGECRLIMLIDVFLRPTMRSSCETRGDMYTLSSQPLGLERGCLWLLEVCRRRPEVSWSWWLQLSYEARYEPHPGRSAILTTSSEVESL